MANDKKTIPRKAIQWQLVPLDPKDASVGEMLEKMAAQWNKELEKKTDGNPSHV